MILGNGHIGEQIRQWRIDMGLTAGEAARRAGISAGAWGRIESGHTQYPLFETIEKMFRGMAAQLEANGAAPADEKTPPPPPQLPHQTPLPWQHQQPPKKKADRLHADA